MMEKGNYKGNDVSPNFDYEVCTFPPPKFRRKSIPYMKKIMELLRDGVYPAQIGKILSRSRSLIHYYVKKLLDYGFIEKEERIDRLKSGEYVKKSRGAITTYRLTQAGSNFLAGIENYVVGPRVRLHNVYWKYPILIQPKIIINWHRVELNNWTQLIGTELGLTVRKNTESIEIVCRSVDGNNPFKLLLMARDEADDLASRLEKKFKMVLGRPSMSRKPHFGVWDPVAGVISDYYEFSSDIGRIDTSLGFGEMEWFSPYSVAEYLRMPRRIKRLEDGQRTLLEGQRLFSEGMIKHMCLISELRQLVKALSKCTHTSDAGTLQEDA